MDTLNTQSLTWTAPTLRPTPARDRASAVGNPPEAVIATRSEGMSPAKKVAFGVGCPACNAYPYRFCFGNRRGTTLTGFHEKRWEMALTAGAA
jgi:hypothetical protein